jgi:hypothetical protein
MTGLNDFAFDPSIRHQHSQLDSTPPAAPDGSDRFRARPVNSTSLREGLRRKRVAGAPRPEDSSGSIELSRWSPTFRFIDVDG